ncbi:hypothetical protein M408DRAFT_10036 [Serendipita vermifera MAFF 305830]|uniref:Uncharacterized protein n=1 Tax=Serendipita vermifera MAFF 305830 TaxID=933852 RepID=A0A0C3ANQ0_SERVB|nr:hypothetical protein M408DRAFT_10036 [Serendipita vermifera MAFF 305830]
MNAPCLEEVVVHSRINSHNLDIPEPSRIHSKSLGWKRLRWMTGPAQGVFEIIHRLSNLINLEISVNGQMLSALFLWLGEMKCLTHLLLGLGSTCSNFQAPANPHVSTTINTLDLIFSYYGSQADRDIADLLFLCCPNTTRLSLFPSDRSSIRIYTSASGFKRLKTMHISPGWWDDEDMSEKKMTSSDIPASFADSVENLSYFASLDVLKLLFPQRVPKVKHLTLDITDHGELVLDPLRWPDMETLTVSRRLEMVWSTGIFRHLSSISVYNSVQVLNWKDPWTPKNVTMICRDIALYLDHFPSLRKLRLEVCPEWDILLILLVRRNIRSTPGIPAITTLEISTRCPPLLIECFKAVIQGIPTTLPTYYELSLAGTLEIARDPSVPGCVTCHRALKICGDIKGQRAARYRRTSWLPSQHIEYPEDESEILRTWETRADQWYPFERAPRANICETQFEMMYDSFNMSIGSKRLVMLLIGLTMPFRGVLSLKLQAKLLLPADCEDIAGPLAYLYCTLLKKSTKTVGCVKRSNTFMVQY